MLKTSGTGLFSENNACGMTTARTKLDNSSVRGFGTRILQAIHRIGVPEHAYSRDFIVFDNI